MQRALSLWLLGALVLVGAQLGCAGNGCSSVRELSGRAFPIGRVSGHVRLADGAVLPEYPLAMLSHEPLRPRDAPEAIPAECAAANRASRAPVAISEGRGLSGIVVTASDFLRNRPRDPVVHRVRIEGCKLLPQTIAMTEHDRLVLENRDAFPFAPLYGPAYGAKPLWRGERLFVPIYPASIEPVSCSPDAPCGRSDVVVFHHPVHTVTGELGAFEIQGFPAAELVRLTALHPLFESSETTVWVEPNERVRVEIVVRPKERFRPSPAPAP